MISNGEYFTELLCEQIPISAQNISLFDPISKVLEKYEKFDPEKIKWIISPNRILFYLAA